MVDDALGAEVRRALALEAPHPSLRPRVIAAMAAEAGGRGHGPRRWIAGLAAAGLAAALVIVLLAVRSAVRPPPLPVPAGTVVGTVPVTPGLGVRCTLPIQVGGAVATLELPSGTVTRYPAGSIRAAAYAGGRWAGVPPASVAPDGHSYAYLANTTSVPGRGPSAALHVRDLPTGTERVVWQGAGWADVVGWTAAGIYAVQEPRGFGLGLTDLLLIDPRSGAARRVGPNPALPANAPTGQLPLFIDSHWIGPDAAWTAFGSHPPAGTSRGHDTVERMDLRTGRLAAWFVPPTGMEVEVIGIDGQGHPILTLAPAPTPAEPNPPVQLLLLRGQNRTVAISGGDQPGLHATGASADRQGVWIGDRGALWLYREGVLRKVADVPAGLLDPDATVRVAGACR